MSRRRDHGELALLWQRLGSDLELAHAGPAGAHVDADLALVDHADRSHRDVAVARRVRAAEQLLVNRLKTHRGELGPLGHPQYGSRIHELFGQPNVQRTRDLLKLHVLDALRHEPRVAEVLRCDVVELARHRDVVRIELDLRLVDLDDPLNLVVPIDLDGGDA
jgi:phage baseplate assembly protein W